MERLSCEETFRRLDDYLDRELTAEEMAMVRSHLDDCAVCAGEYRFEAGVIESVRAKLRRISAPPNLLERVSQLLRGLPDERR